jgi:hypothetical protein
MSKVELKLDWCTHEAAKYAVEKWHYSQKMPVNKTAKIGVWENNRFIGAVIYSCGSAGVSSYGKRFGLRLNEVCELARVALDKHQSSVTQIVAISLKVLKKGMPNLRLVVSYADPAQGHIGGIYQGGNWIYVGRSSKDVAYKDRNGKVWHSRSVSETGYKVHCGVKTRCPKPSEMTAIELEPKYKYLMPLDAEIRKQINIISQDYPKRVTSIDSDVSGNQSEEGGASPTVTLHKSKKVSNG